MFRFIARDVDANFDYFLQHVFLELPPLFYRHNILHIDPDNTLNKATIGAYRARVEHHRANWSNITPLREDAVLITIPHVDRHRGLHAHA